MPAHTRRVQETIQRSRFITTVSHAPGSAVALQFVKQIKQEFPDAQVLSKPVSEDRVVAELKRLIESRPAGR